MRNGPERQLTITNAIRTGKFEAIVGNPLKLRVQEPWVEGKRFWVRTTLPVRAINPSGVALGDISIPWDSLMGPDSRGEVRIVRYPGGPIVAVKSLLR